MSVWKLRLERGRDVLVPLKGQEEVARAISASVPGAQCDDGRVEGSRGAVLACLAAAGQPAPFTWRGEPQVLAPSWMPEYQRFGADFTSAIATSGVMNNDDMGLGKTLQTIAGCEAGEMRDHVKVVLCPGFLRRQWQEELLRWVPKVRKDGASPRVQVIWPLSDKRTKLAPVEDPTWVVAYYNDYERAVQAAGRKSYVLIVDEIQNLQGFKSQRMNSLKAASNFAAGRVGLTASPLQSDAVSLFPALDLICPGAFGTYWQYAKRYASAQPGEFGLVIGKLSNVDELRHRLSLHAFRRTKTEVAAQMPFETRYQTVWVDPPGGNQGAVKGAMLSPMGAGMAQHLRAVADCKVGPVTEQVQSDRLPSITFTWLREHAEKIAASIPGSMLVLGGSDGASRLDRIGAYVAKCKALGQVPSLVATMDSIGVGANLQWAKVVNIAALDYTPDKLRQAIGRAARMGQTGTVIIRIFVCKNTIDEHYIKVLLDKLSEQARLDGRKEEAKQDLADALSPRETKDALRSIYERMLREEADVRAS